MSTSAAEVEEARRGLPVFVAKEVRSVEALPKGHYGEALRLEAEATEFSHNTGRAVDDAQASGRRAWEAALDTDWPGHLLFGPYFELGAGDYVAFFRIRIADDWFEEVVAKLDACVSEGRKILAENEVLASELIAGQYVQIPLAFHHPGGKLECRLYWPGAASLAVDKVTVFRITGGHLGTTHVVKRVAQPVASGLPKDLVCGPGSGLAGQQHFEMFPRSKAPEANLLVFEVNKQPRDWQLLLYTLQGIVNREKPRIYFITNDQDRHWLSWMLKKGWIKSTQMLEKPEELVSRFRGSLKGVVIPDPALPATRNVATMIAGVEDGAVASPRLAKKLGLPAIADLRGRWKTNLEAYRWALDTLWPRMNHSVLACLWPDSSEVRDYLVQHKIFIFWIPGPIDGAKKYSRPDEEMRFAEELLARTPANTPVMGYSYAGPEVGIGEGGGVTLFSEFAKFLVGSVNASNLSVRSGISVGHFRQPVRPAPELRDDKVYVCFTISDGDNLPVVTAGNWPQLWADKTRGEFPIGWTISPSAFLLIPDVVDYYYSTATPGDTFMAAVSGVGYCYPEFYAKRFRQSDRERVFDGFLRLTDTYMRKMDLRAVCPHLANVPEIERYAERVSCAQAVFPDYGRRVTNYEDACYAAARGVPVFRAATGWNQNASREQQIKELASQVREMAASNRPAFIHIFICNWFWDLPAMKEVLGELGPDYVAVGPDQLAALGRLDMERKQVQIGSLPSIAFFEGETVRLTIRIRNTSRRPMEVLTSVAAGLDRAKVHPSEKHLEPWEEFTVDISGVPTGDSIRLEVRGPFGTRERKSTLRRVRSSELVGGVPEPTRLTCAALYEAESLSHNSGQAEKDGDASGQTVWSSPSDAKGPSHIVYGPYASLEPGRYLAVFRLKRTGKGSGVAVHLDTCVVGAGTVTSARDVTVDELPVGDYKAFPLEFDHPGGPFETRVFWTGNAPVVVDYAAVWEVKPL